jgi:hypothetical protein
VLGELVVSPIHRCWQRPDEPIVVTGWSAIDEPVNNFHVTIAPSTWCRRHSPEARVLSSLPLSLGKRKKTIRMDYSDWERIVTAEIHTNVAPAK